MAICMCRTFSNSSPPAPARQQQGSTNNATRDASASSHPHAEPACMPVHRPWQRNTQVAQQRATMSASGMSQSNAAQRNRPKPARHKYPMACCHACGATGGFVHVFPSKSKANPRRVPHYAPPAADLTMLTNFLTSLSMEASERDPS